MRSSFSNFIEEHPILLLTTTFTLLLLTSAGLLYLTTTERITAPVASLAATVMLVILTGIYAAVTYWMAQETKKAREQEIRPVLDFHSREIYSEIVNHGGGPARNIDITLTLQPAGESHRVQQQSLPAGESLSIPVEPFSSIGDQRFTDLQLQGLDVDWSEIEDETDVWEEHDYPYESLEMECSYEDVWGNLYTPTRNYEVWNLTEETGGTISHALDEEDSLHKISSELGSIRRLMEQRTAEEEGRTDFQQED